MNPIPVTVTNEEYDERETRAIAIRAAAMVVQPLAAKLGRNENVSDTEQYLFVLADDISRYILTGKNRHL